HTKQMDPNQPLKQGPQPHQRHPQTQRWAPANDRSPHTTSTLSRTTPAPAPPHAPHGEPSPHRPSPPSVSTHAYAHAWPTDPHTPCPRCDRARAANTAQETPNPPPRPQHHFCPHPAPGPTAHAPDPHTDPEPTNTPHPHPPQGCQDHAHPTPD